MSSSPRSGGPAGSGPEGAQGIVTAIAEISDRATLLVREEIELAKAEMAEKATKLAKGAAVGMAAGIFFMGALWFVLLGLAWLLYYYLPIGNDFTYFWGFFAMALILVILGAIAGLIAARAVKRGAPPTPDLAIEEARRIRETVATTEPTPVVAPTPPAPYGAAAPAGDQPPGAASDPTSAAPTFNPTSDPASNPTSEPASEEAG